MEGTYNNNNTLDRRAKWRGCGGPTVAAAADAISRKSTRGVMLIAS